MFPSPKPCIFVVDDEPVIVSTLVAILNASGFRATGFTNPTAAMDSALTGSPDVLISDVMMPEMSGVDLAIQLQAVCPACKILLFSGQADTADLLITARDNGHAFTLLTKPVHPSELLAVLGGVPRSSDHDMRPVKPGICGRDVLQGVPFS